MGNLTLTFDISKDIIDVDFHIVELNSSIQEDEDLKTLIDEYHVHLEEIKDELRNVEQIDPDRGWYYSGWSTCSGECHATQINQWNETDHANAFRSLTQKGQIYNKECIPCHTTGWGYTGGFIISDETPEMEGVQCEMCHGARGEHIETQNVAFETITEATCVKCHKEENSPDFDYNSCYLAVAH
jgi:hypothetical protein